jgi:hypothetical protein
MGNSGKSVLGKVSVKTYAKFSELPIDAITPRGWLWKYLDNQRNGLTGHLDEAAGAPFDKLKHTKLTSDNWYAHEFEQVSYWIDGMIRCGYLLRDEFLINKAKEQIEYVLRNPDRDGYLGPQSLKESPHGGNRWPHTVFFRAVMAYYSVNKDKSILDALMRHYLSGTSEHTRERDVCNVEIMLWLYEKTGDKRIKDYALESYEGYNRLYKERDTSVESMLSAKVMNEHGVTFNEIGKLGAIVYKYTGNKKYLDATINAYKKIDRDQMLIDGVCSSTERLRGKDPLDSHETCNISDYTWSVGYLLMVSGGAEYADKIERACFNAAPGAVTADFRALQYFSCPNQVIADSSSNHNFYRCGDKWMSYRPKPGTECCSGDVNRAMPNYVARMWLLDNKNSGLVAALYGPSSVVAIVGEGRQAEVNIVEETSYPFSEEINFHIYTKRDVLFTLFLRIPIWCEKPQLLINNKPARKINLRRGTFVSIRRLFSNGDCVKLILPMELKLSHWPRNGVGIERGPIVFSLPIEEEWQVDKNEISQSAGFPAWNIYPRSKWNYALDLTEDELKEKVEVVKRVIPLDDTNFNPWDVKSAPVELYVPARLVRGWRIKKRKRLIYEDCDKLYKRVGNFSLTPNLPEIDVLKKNLSQRLERIKLVPYGCTQLRITIFPNAASVLLRKEAR